MNRGRETRDNEEIYQKDDFRIETKTKQPPQHTGNDSHVFDKK